MHRTRRVSKNPSSSWFSRRNRPQAWPIRLSQARIGKLNSQDHTRLQTVERSFYHGCSGSHTSINLKKPDIEGNSVYHVINLDSIISYPLHMGLQII